MTTLKDVKLSIASTGHVFYGPPDTAALKLNAFAWGTESTYGDWKWLGDTSSENLIEFSTDGGEVTYKRTWDREKVRAARDAVDVTATINAVGLSRELFTVAFASGTANEGDDSYTVRTGASSSSRAIFIVWEDDEGIAGLYLPNTSLAGTFPSFDLENFLEIPLNLSLLASSTDVTAEGAALWSFYLPRKKAVVPAVK